MSNQFLRNQKREQESKDKEMSEKINKLLIYVNLAIVKYHRVLEVNLKLMPNGSIMPVKSVKRAGKQEQKEALKWLLQRKVKPEARVWSFRPSKDFLGYIEKHEREIGVEIAPGVSYNVFGIIPTFAFRTPSLLPVEGAEPAPALHSGEQNKESRVDEGI